MYERHFGFSRPPFRITPDPELFFAGGNRGAVLEALVYAVTRGEGIVKVVGEVGSGKTMLCRMLERALPDACSIVYLANPNLSPAEVLHAIAFELKLPLSAAANRLEVMQALQEYLLARHAENRHVVMFVEEAQAMPLETLEEMRLLSNLETTREKLLQIVLFGQPELDDKLDDHAIRQLRERITHSFELEPFGAAEIAPYLEARLRACGYRGHTLFDRGAVRELARQSRGLLRRINVLADKALLAAFAGQDRTVTAAHVRRAARDAEFARQAARPPVRRRLALAAVLLGVFALGAWLIADREILPPAPSASVPPAAPPAPAAEPAMLDDEAPDHAAQEPLAAAPLPKSPPAPHVAPATGLVGHTHLVPRLDPPPTPSQR